MRFSLPSIKYSATPPSFRLGCLNCTQRFDLISARSAVVGSWEEPPNIWLTAAKSAFGRCDLNFRVRMLLKSAVKCSWGTVHREESQKRPLSLPFFTGKSLFLFLRSSPANWIPRTGCQCYNKWTWEYGGSGVNPKCELLLQPFCQVWVAWSKCQWLWIVTQDNPPPELPWPR